MYACLNIKWEWIVVDVRRQHSGKEKKRWTGESSRTGSKRDDGNILFMVTQPHCFIVIQESLRKSGTIYFSFSLEVDEKYDDRGTTTQSTFLDGYNLLPPSLCRIMHKKRNYVLIKCGNGVFIFLLAFRPATGEVVNMMWSNILWWLVF